MKRFIRGISIITAVLRHRAAAEKAYIGNFWSELSSTSLYVITFIVFIDLLFRRTGEISGYSKDDFLFMTFVGQLTFYVVAICLAEPMRLLVQNVRTGAFDLMLLKPVAIRPYTYASAIRPWASLLATVPNLAILAWVINWSTFTISIVSLAIGILVWFAGLIVFNTVLLLLVYPVFSEGEATDMVEGFYSLMHVTEMPYNLLPSFMKVMSFVIFPGVIMTGGTTQVILNNGPDTLAVLPPSILTAIVALFFQRYIWRHALRNYTSASS